MEIVIGTSGWLYKDWDDIFYPVGMKSKDKFAYFTTKFPSVEINSTFYHVPRESTVQNWYDTAPAGFQFVIKLNRFLTHTKRLQPDKEFDENLYDFLRRTALLKEKLAAILVQLPPGLRADQAYLAHFLRQVREIESKIGIIFPLALEFRHASWFTDEIFALMRKANAANVINDSPDRWPASREITADFSYIRFHGNRQLYRSSYTDAELRQWADFIAGLKARSQKVFCYFNNDYDGVAINNARTLQGLVAEL